jgi:hypothetical protein
MRGHDLEDTEARDGPAAPPAGISGPWVAALLAVVAAGAVAACSEAGLVSAPGGDAPGSAAETREVIVPVSEFGTWRDSTFGGFATPSTTSWILAAQDSAFQSRALLRFGAVPDTVIINAQLLPVDSVGRILLRFGADTARSSFTGDSVTVSVFTLDRHFDPDEAEWGRAAEGDPWPGGGSLVRRLGRQTVPTSVDTFTVGVRGDADAFYEEWRNAGAPPSMALTVDGTGNRLFLRNAVLEFLASPPDQDTLASATSVVEERTSIYDPPQPAVGRSLRLGGVPSSRAYFTITPPDSVDGFPLRGSQINRADLLLWPLPGGSPTFRPRGVLNLVALELLGDPFELGAKTPVGQPLAGGQVFRLDADSLAAGRPLEVNVTSLFAQWARFPEDSTAEFRLGLRPLPDGARFGYWDFGSVDADSAALRPMVRLLFTPPTSFELP